MGASILVIDADTDFSNRLADALRAADLTPLLATDGKVGLDLAREKLPAAIVVCVELPRMSGYSVCTKIRKDEALKSIPVVITSSGATPETFESHSRLSTRADEYMKKPFPPTMLVDVLRPHIVMSEGPVQVDGEEVDIVDDVAEAPATLGDDEAFSPDEVRSLDGGYEVGNTTARHKAAPDPEATSRGEGGLSASFLMSPAALTGISADNIDEAEALTSVGVLESALPLPTPAPRRNTSLAGPAPATPAGPSAAEAAARRQVDSLRAELERAQASLESAHRERDDALAQVEASKSSQLPAAGASSSRELLDLKRERNAKDKEILALKQQLSEKERELLEWRDKESELDENIVRLTEEAARTEAARSAIESKAAAEGRTAQQTIGDLKRRLAESSSREADLDGTVQALQQDLDGARVALDELTRAEAELRETHQSTEDRLHAAEARGSALEASLNKTQGELSRTSEERDRVRRELEQRTRDLDARLQELDARSRELDHRTRDLEQRTRERDDLELSLDQARAEAAVNERKLTGEVDALTGEVDRLTGESERLSSDVERQGSEISRLGNELSAASAEANSLRDQLRQSGHEIEQAHAESARLEGVIAAERTEKDGLRGLIDEINAERERSEGHLSSAYTRIREDEAIRSKALQALEIAVALLKEAGYSSTSATAADGEPTTGVVRS